MKWEEIEIEFMNNCVYKPIVGHWSVLHISKANIIYFRRRFIQFMMVFIGYIHLWKLPQ